MDLALLVGFWRCTKSRTRVIGTTSVTLESIDSGLSCLSRLFPRLFRFSHVFYRLSNPIPMSSVSIHVRSHARHPCKPPNNNPRDTGSSSLDPPQIELHRDSLLLLARSTSLYLITRSCRVTYASAANGFASISKTEITGIFYRRQHCVMRAHVWPVMEIAHFEGTSTCIFVLIGPYLWTICGDCDDPTKVPISKHAPNIVCTAR